MSGKQNAKAIAAKLPKDALRVKVTDKDGNLRWRNRDEVKTTDTIVTKKSGEPIVMKNLPGRKGGVGKPKVSLPDPKNPEVAEWVRQRESVVVNDPIVTAMGKNPDSTDILDHILKEMAKEAASLDYDKSVAEREGDSTSGFSSRRLKALRTIGETWLKKKKEIDSSTLEFDSPAFKTLFSHIMQTFQYAMRESGLPSEMVDLVFDNLSKKMDAHWEQEAKNKIKNTIRGVPS